MAAIPKNTGCSSTNVALVKTVGAVTRSSEARTDPPRVAAPAVTSTVTHTSDWKKSNVEVFTTCVSVPSSPPARAARKAPTQNTMTRAAVGLIPRLSVAVGESASARSTLPSRVTRTASMAVTPTTTRTSTK
jgi:hypothetical protein